MRIAVFSNRFPILSETFVINQVIGLIENKVEIDIYANTGSLGVRVHQSVFDYGLMEKVKYFGFKSTIKNNFKVKKIFSYMKKFLKLKFIHDFISILFDEELSFKQKLNLLVLIIFTDNKKPSSYHNIICHFGDFAYYVCKVRDLGFIEGPISVVFHGYELSKYKEIEKNERMYKKVFLKANLMLPISNLWKQRLISWGCDEKKIIVHHMGIDIDKYYFRNDSVKLQKPLKVLQVGRLTYKKAILDSIEAIHQVSKFIPVSFTIIGDGELFNHVQAEIKKKKLENIIDLLGPLSQDDVLRYLINSDIFLLPSVTALDGDMEGIPVAIMEAMAMGLIVLSTFHSGIPELVEHEYSGFLVEEHDPSMIAHTLLRISNLSTQELSEVRNNARNKCVEDFNNLILNKKIIDYFR